VVGCLLGSVFYRIVVALALEADFLGLEASDLNLVTAVLVGIALILPATRAKLLARRAPAR
jgi:putative ABC transport system permease protein